jgi:AAA15 family ATPase/GTPase
MLWIMDRPWWFDELEYSLHPELTRFIINILHSEKANPKNAQLIFATHDLSLFNRRFFRRDQSTSWSWN